MTLTLTLQSLLAEAKPSQTKCTIIKVDVAKDCSIKYINSGLNTLKAKF